MTREQWKDWLEGFGIVAIIGSLIFVGLQMRQAQSIAVAEAEGAQQTIDNRVPDAINQHAGVWSKGASGRELSEAEAIIFENLVIIASTQAFFSYSQRKILNHPRADLAAHRFAFFLFQNPGARHVWMNYIHDLERADAVLSVDIQAIPEWREMIRNDLMKLDQSTIDSELSER